MSLFLSILAVALLAFSFSRRNKMAGIAGVGLLASAIGIAVFSPSNPDRVSLAATPGPEVTINPSLIRTQTDEPVVTDTPQADADPPESTPKPDHHAERQAIQTYWNHVINSLAMANESTVAASASVQNDDLVSASQFLKQGQEAAIHARDMSQSEVPDGYSEVGASLFTASDTFADAISKESDFIDNRTPSVGAEALEQRQRAQSEIEDAQHAARLKYVDLGGKIGDLSSFADAANAADQLLKMLSH